MTFELIGAERAQHPVSLLCGVLGVTRGGFYAWKRRGRSKRSLEDDLLGVVIQKVHSESLETYGVPRIHAELADDYAIHIGRKRVARLMRQLRIEGVSRRGKRRYKTTIPAKEQPAAPDLVGRSFQAAGPNRLWVADITYVSTWEGFLFLACVIDAWSRRVVGWSMRDDLRAELVVDALGMALTQRRPAAGVVHHSDRGSQTGFKGPSQRCWFTGGS
jgi:putative transposase